MSKKVWGGAALLAGIVLAPMLLLPTIASPPAIPAASGDGSVCTAPVVPAGATLTAQTIADHAYRAGFRGDDIDIAVAVARAESGWNAKATNANTNGSVDYGLMQINSIHAAILSAGNWADPGDNMVMAFKVFSDVGGKWTPWVTFWSGSYKKFLTSVDAEPVCTKPVFAACAATKDLDQYGNGLIPKSALCTLKTNPNHRLRADAAGSFDAMTKAYEQKFGPDSMCLTDSYRTLAAQIDVRRRKPGLAAIPGTSNHGWGLAVDLCSPGGGQWVRGSTYDIWMHQNAPTFGWVHPGWAEPSGSKPEPWHWGFPTKGHRA